LIASVGRVLVKPHTGPGPLRPACVSYAKCMMTLTTPTALVDSTALDMMGKCGHSSDKSRCL
jgi:hypothetical protein